jgi:hypothetical protein
MCHGILHSCQLGQRLHVVAQAFKHRGTERFKVTKDDNLALNDVPGAALRMWMMLHSQSLLKYRCCHTHSVELACSTHNFRHGRAAGTSPVQTAPDLRTLHGNPTKQQVSSMAKGSPHIAQPANALSVRSSGNPLA